MSNSITRSYTFANGGTADGGQVDSEFNNIVNTVNNADAGTTRWTVVDATTLKLGGQSAAQWFGFRQPVLQYSSATVVNLETGLTGTSGQAVVLFHDGSYRTDSTSGRINCNLAQNAVLSGSAQSGFRTGSIAANSWVSFYAVKVTDSSANFVVVADTVIPTQANYSTLNSNFGTNGWVYLGTLPYGDNSGATTAIPKFVMSGNRVSFYNSVTAATSARGLRLANTAGATSLVWTYAAGTDLSSAQIPAHILLGDVGMCSAAQAQLTLLDSAGTFGVMSLTPSSGVLNVIVPNWTLSQGLKENSGSSVAKSILLHSYQDGVLGVGMNPLL